MIQVEVLYDRQRKYFTTGIKVLPHQWKNGIVIGLLNSMELNDRINAIHDNIMGYINSCIKEKKEFSFDSLVKSLDVSKSHSDCFIDFVEHRINDRKMKDSTKKQHLVFLRRLKDFGVIKSFGDITLKNIKIFDDYIKRDDLTQSSIYSFHKRMKVYIREGIQYELLDKNPYDSISIPRGETTQRKYLSLTELEMIREALIESKSIAGVRDCFVFCCFTGLAYADLNKFNWNTDVICEDGKYIIRDVRMKTSTPYSIMLLTPALDILKKHKNNLPKMSNQQYNMRLKLVAEYARLNKNLTSHLARHTFAVMMLDLGAEIYTVSKLLGHKELKTTQIYAKVLDKKKQEAVNLIPDILPRVEEL